MTSDSDSFLEAFREFRALPYPDYPQTEELRDWNSRLLTLDGWIAGYATQIESNSLAPIEIPDLPGLMGLVTELYDDLDRLRLQAKAEVQLVEQYQLYMNALRRLVVEIDSLRQQNGAP